MTMDSNAQLNASLAAAMGGLLEKELQPVIHPVKSNAEADVPGLVLPGGSRRRRAGFSTEDYDGKATLMLIDDEGVLRWQYQPPSYGVRGRRARRRSMAPIGTDIVGEFSFRETPPNEVVAALERLDLTLTPERGLRRLDTATMTLSKVPRGTRIEGPVLLLVHGTFSKSDMFVDELGSFLEGKAFLGRAAAKYKAILAFDHPTLSVSPWINALDLDDALAGVDGPIDVVSHSRGGLVVSWWLHNAERKVKNVVFVGTPLQGTSLASPANLRKALDGLANVLKGLQAASALASTVAPFMTAVTGLASILGGVARLGASTPLLDAAVAIVPGLTGQAAVGNNAELDRLHRAGWVSKAKFYAVRSDFEPVDKNEAWWKIWNFLRNPVDRILDIGADAIFNKTANDLVVNTGSMTHICQTELQVDDICDFETSKTVHHCNYFRQPKTVKFLGDKLAV